MCEAYNEQYNTNYVCLMPTNLYGPNDNYDLQHSHFYPALISNIAKKKLKPSQYGAMKSKRELMYVDDL